MMDYENAGGHEQTRRGPSGKATHHEQLMILAGLNPFIRRHAVCLAGRSDHPSTSQAAAAIMAHKLIHSIP